ncbi:unnamed protein product [Amoebophrya sp. A25]|nr:unnamed protein product [Amoebophrya sp. A25]|eukprot:GSA25T00006112001.1
MASEHPYEAKIQRASKRLAAMMNSAGRRGRGRRRRKIKRRSVEAIRKRVEEMKTTPQGQQLDTSEQSKQAVAPSENHDAKAEELRKYPFPTKPEDQLRDITWNKGPSLGASLSSGKSASLSAALGGAEDESASSETKEDKPQESQKMTSSRKSAEDIARIAEKIQNGNQDKERTSEISAALSSKKITKVQQKTTNKKKKQIKSRLHMTMSMRKKDAAASGTSSKRNKAIKSKHHQEQEQDQKVKKVVVEISTGTENKVESENYKQESEVAEGQGTDKNMMQKNRNPFAPLYGYGTGTGSYPTTLSSPTASAWTPTATYVSPNYNTWWAQLVNPAAASSPIAAASSPSGGLAVVPAAAGSTVAPGTSSAVAPGSSPVLPGSASAAPVVPGSAIPVVAGSSTPVVPGASSAVPGASSAVPAASSGGFSSSAAPSGAAAASAAGAAAATSGNPLPGGSTWGNPSSASGGGVVTTPAPANKVIWQWAAQPTTCDVIQVEPLATGQQLMPFQPLIRVNATRARLIASGCGSVSQDQKRLVGLNCTNITIFSTYTGADKSENSFGDVKLLLEHVGTGFTTAQTAFETSGKFGVMSCLDAGSVEHNGRTNQWEWRGALARMPGDPYTQGTTPDDFLDTAGTETLRFNAIQCGRMLIKRTKNDKQMTPIVALSDGQKAATKLVATDCNSIRHYNEVDGLKVCGMDCYRVGIELAGWPVVDNVASFCLEGCSNSVDAAKAARPGSALSSQSYQRSAITATPIATPGSSSNSASSSSGGGSPLLFRQLGDQKVDTSSLSDQDSGSDSALVSASSTSLSGPGGMGIASRLPTRVTSKLVSMFTDGQETSATTTRRAGDTTTASALSGIISVPHLNDGDITTSRDDQAGSSKSDDEDPLSGELSSFRKANLQLRNHIQQIRNRGYNHAPSSSSAEALNGLPTIHDPLPINAGLGVGQETPSLSSSSPTGSHTSTSSTSSMQQNVGAGSLIKSRSELPIDDGHLLERTSSTGNKMDDEIENFIQSNQVVGDDVQLHTASTSLHQSDITAGGRRGAAAVSSSTSSTSSTQTDAIEEAYEELSRNNPSMREALERARKRLLLKEDSHGQRDENPSSLGVDRTTSDEQNAARPRGLRLVEGQPGALDVTFQRSREPDPALGLGETTSLNNSRMSDSELEKLVNYGKQEADLKTTVNKDKDSSLKEKDAEHDREMRSSAASLASDILKKVEALGLNPTPSGAVDDPASLRSMVAAVQAAAEDSGRPPAELHRAIPSAETSSTSEDEGKLRAAIAGTIKPVGEASSSASRNSPLASRSSTASRTAAAGTTDTTSISRTSPSGAASSLSRVPLSRHDHEFGSSTTEQDVLALMKGLRMDAPSSTARRGASLLQIGDALAAAIRSRRAPTSSRPSSTIWSSEDEQPHAYHDGESENFQFHEQLKGKEFHHDNPTVGGHSQGTGTTSHRLEERGQPSSSLFAVDLVGLG